jgi:methylmalonyl-CoA mutase N-terminal domain/subunit
VQSLHTDSYDEVLSVPTAEAARIAVATQNVLREEAQLTDVIDPLGGSYYLETLTDQMEEKIESVIERIDAAGGMYRAVEQGLVQRMIGESALAFQKRVESGEQTIVGVNAFQVDEDADAYTVLEYPARDRIDAQLARLADYKAQRAKAPVQKALDALARAAQGSDNVMAQVVEAADAGATHGEICAVLRRELGFGQPLVIA